MKQLLNVTDAISRLATREGIDPKGLVRSEDELQAEAEAQAQEQQQQQIQDMAMQAGSKVAGNIPPQSLGAALQEAQNITEGN